MGRIKETSKKAAVNCVRGMCVMTGWAAGMTMWGAHTLTSATQKAVRAAKKRKECICETERVSPEMKKKRTGLFRKIRGKTDFTSPARSVTGTIPQTAVGGIDPDEKEVEGEQAGFYERTLLKQAVRDITDEQPSRRYNSIVTLESIAPKIGLSAVIAPLVNALRDTNGNIRSHACKVLIDLGARDAVTEILPLLEDNSARARLEAIRGVYRLSSDTASVVGYLLGAAKDHHREVRKRAATYLGWFEGDKISSALVELLGDKESVVRKTAVLALGELRDRVTIAPLIRVLNDKNREVREMAIYTLRMLTGKKFEYAPELEPPEREKIIEKWNKWWILHQKDFKLCKKEFGVMMKVPMKSNEEAAETAKKAAEDKAKKEAAETAKKAAEDKAKKEAAETAKKAVDAERKSAGKIENKDKKPLNVLRGKIANLRPEDKDKLKSRLDQVKGMLDKRKGTDQDRKKRLNSIKNKMEDLEQMLLLKNDSRDKKKNR